MREVRVVTPEGVQLRREIAGAGSRFCAAVIDGLIVGLGVLLLLVMLGLLSQIDASGLSEFLLGLALGGSLLVVLGYQLLFGVLADGSTPGKRALGLRVVSVDGWPASGAQHLLRTLLWPVDVLLPVPLPFFGLLGLVVVLTTERRQRLGDLVAGTVVEREAPARVRPEPLAGERWSTLEERTLALTPGLAARLGEDDRVLLRELLARDDLSAARRRKLLRSAAEHYARRLELSGDVRPERAIAELYLYLRESRERART